MIKETAQRKQNHIFVMLDEVCLQYVRYQYIEVFLRAINSHRSRIIIIILMHIVHFERCPRAFN